jgi:hypothetical protein
VGGIAARSARVLAVAAVSVFGFMLTGCTNSGTDSVATPSAASAASRASFVASASAAGASFDAAFTAAKAQVAAAVATMTPDQRHAVAIQWLTVGAPWSDDPITAARATWASLYLNLPNPASLSDRSPAKCAQLGDDVWPLAAPNAYDHNVDRLTLDNDCTAGRIATGVGAANASNCQQLASDLWPLADPNAYEYNVDRINLDGDCVAGRLPIGDLARNPAACVRFTEDIFPLVDPSGTDHNADRINLNDDCVAGRLPS